MPRCVVAGLVDTVEDMVENEATMEATMVAIPMVVVNGALVVAMVAMVNNDHP
jgi:hypothetical protein